MAEIYQANDVVRPIDVFDIRDLKKEAGQVIPKGGFGYIVGGAGDGWTLRQNTEAFNHKQLAPRVLADLEKPDPSTSIL